MSWRTRERLWGAARAAGLFIFWLAALAALAPAAASLAASPSKITAMKLFNLGFAAVAWWLGYRGLNFGIIALQIWRDTRRVQPPAVWSRRRAMWRLHQIAASTNFLQRSHAFYAVYAAFGVAALALTRDPRWLGLVAYGAGTLAWVWTRFSTPPFVLYLSTSDPGSVAFHNQLQMLVRPLRAMSLLNVASAAGTENSTSLGLDCLRTSNDDDWWPAITMLIQMATLVVINADKESPGVIREAVHIVNQDIKYKTVFLTGGSAPLMRTVAEVAAHSPGCLIARTPILEAVVAEIVDRRLPPSPARSVWDFARTARTETGVWDGVGKGTLGDTFSRRTPLGVMARNPYLNIMMICPTTGQPTPTGINSAYFEEWNGHPPKDGASFLCSACGQTHSFDNTTTWLEHPP